MKKSIVTPTFLKQKAKKLKKEKSISLHQALEKLAIENGFSNYKHFLNDWESNLTPKTNSEVESLLRSLDLETDMAKRLLLVIDFLQNNKISFPEMFSIFEQFRHSESALQIVCENSSFLDHVVSTMMLQYFHRSKEDLQALPLKEHFIAKNIIVEDIECELITERLNVKGLYTLELEFEHLNEVPEDIKHLSHFNRAPMFGEFELTIDRNKQVTIANPTIGEISDDGTPYFSKFKLGKEYLEEIKLHREKELEDIKQAIRSNTKDNQK